jgi:hypothetical protein
VLLFFLACFPSDTLVETLDRGNIRIAELKKGDLIKTYDLKQQKWSYSRFVTYLHSDNKIVTRYIAIRTSNNKSLSISPLHLIAKRTSGGSIEFVFAKDLQLNDVIVSEGGTSGANEHQAVYEKIAELRETYESGAYAPLTEHGTVAVNSLMASCYANTRFHNFIHLLFQPVIFVSKYFNDNGALDSESHKLLTPSRTTIGMGDEANMFTNMFWYAEFLLNLLPFVPFSSSIVVF